MTKETAARQAVLIKLAAGGGVRTVVDAAVMIREIEDNRWEGDLRALYAALLVLTRREPAAIARLSKADRPFADVVIARMAMHYLPLGEPGPAPAA